LTAADDQEIKLVWHFQAGNTARSAFTAAPMTAISSPPGTTSKT
jgi:hypothetical protein